jgi:hypothetical protein
LKRTVRVAATAATLVAAAAAHAAEVGPAAAVLTGYAVEADTILNGAVDPYRIGLGARVGTTFSMHLYLGAAFVVHFGSEVSASGNGGALYDARYHVAYWGGEAGYDFDVGRFLVRPYSGSGLLASLGHTTVRGGSTGSRDGFFYLAPGVVAAYRVHRALVGIDLRMPLVFAEAPIQWAPAVMLTAGTHL